MDLVVDVSMSAGRGLANTADANNSCEVMSEAKGSLLKKIESLINICDWLSLLVVVLKQGNSLLPFESHLDKPRLNIRELCLACPNEPLYVFEGFHDFNTVQILFVL